MPTTTTAIGGCPFPAVVDGGDDVDGVDDGIESIVCEFVTILIFSLLWCFLSK
jgi:hypothetical protein